MLVVERAMIEIIAVDSMNRKRLIFIRYAKFCDHMICKNLLICVRDISHTIIGDMGDDSSYGRWNLTLERF